MTSLPSWSDYGTHDESAYPELWDGVIGAWAPCLGPTGSRLHDMSRRNNWGTIQNRTAAAAWDSQNGQYAVSFNNTAGQRISFNQYSLGDFTLSNWVLITSIPAGGSVIWDDATSGGFFGWYYTASLVYFRDAGGFVSLSYSLPTSRWLHLCATRKGSAITLFVDSVVIGTLTLTGTATISSIGGVDNNNDAFSVNGLLDDCVIWPFSISQDQVRQLYQLGRGGMLERRRRRRVYTEQAGFRAHYATQRNAQLIGGGLR
jgi:hypothetical protein